MCVCDPCASLCRFNIRFNAALIDPACEWVAPPCTNTPCSRSICVVLFGPFCDDINTHSVYRILWLCHHIQTHTLSETATYPANTQTLAHKCAFARFGSFTSLRTVSIQECHIVQTAPRAAQYRIGCSVDV